MIDGTVQVTESWLVKELARCPAVQWQRMQAKILEHKLARPVVRLDESKRFARRQMQPANHRRWQRLYSPIESCLSIEYIPLHSLRHSVGLVGYLKCFPSLTNLLQWDSLFTSPGPNLRPAAMQI